MRPRLPDGRPRQGEGQAGLLPVLLREEEAREADKARLALGPSARKERWEASVPPACRRDLANIGLGGYARQLWGPHRLKTPAAGLGRRRRAAGFVICETELTLAIMTTFSPSVDVMAQRSSCVSRPCSAVGMDAEMRYAADVGGGTVSIKGWEPPSSTLRLFLTGLLEELTYVQYNISAHTSIGVSCLALL